MTAVDEVLTPTVRAWWRRARFWFGAGMLVVVIAIVAMAMNGTGGGGSPLDPANPAPIGSKALAEVLRQQGIEVIVAERHEEVAAVLADGAPTTLLVDDQLGILAARSLDAIAALDASTVVLLDPTQDALDAFLPGVRRSGMTSDPSEGAECALPVASGLGGITGRSTLFDLGDADAIGCYPTPLGLVRIATAPGAIALGPLDALSNERIVEAANAAVALRVLGAEPRLVWYRPGLAEADIEVPPTLADLSPGWVVPVALLLVATFLAAAFWRGRRLGPLVVERLPSIVPADETVRGRARMYARARARLRAADALRIGTLGRIGRELGLPASAGVETIALAAAGATGRSPDRLRELLRDEVPGDDAALVRLAAELTRLEREITRVTRPTQAGE